jgi:hypothetical protein
MSIKVATEVWRGSRHKSGNLLVLLALADHADDQGKAWPGVSSLARKARLSERHTRRCLSELLVSGELEILPEPAPSGGKWYQIQLEHLTPDILSIETSASKDVTPVSATTDIADRATGNTYIVQEPPIEPSEEPSNKSSEVLRSQNRVSHLDRKKSLNKCTQRRPDAIGLISQPNNGF